MVTTATDEFLKRLEEYVRNNFVKCPHCGGNIEGELNDLHLWDGESEEIECPHCGAVLKVTCWVSFDYDVELVKKPENDAEYKFEDDPNTLILPGFDINREKRDNELERLGEISQ